MSNKFVHYKIPTVNKTACGLDIMRTMGTSSCWENTTCEWCHDKKPKEPKVVDNLQLHSISIVPAGEGTGYIESVKPVE